MTSLCPLLLGKDLFVIRLDACSSCSQFHKAAALNTFQGLSSLTKQRATLHYHREEVIGLWLSDYAHFQSNYSTGGFKHQILRSWELVMLVFFFYLLNADYAEDRSDHLGLRHLSFAGSLLPSFLFIFFLLFTEFHFSHLHLKFLSIFPAT